MRLRETRQVYARQDIPIKSRDENRGHVRRIDAAAVTFLNKHLNGPMRLLNAHLLHLDSEEGICRVRFEIVPAFCHSGGRICQGGFLTGMVDSAMAHAAIARSKLKAAVPTLEIKVSFFEAMGPGVVFAEGRVMRWGGSVGFLDGDLKDEKGRLIVHATSTIKIIYPKK